MILEGRERPSLFLADGGSELDGLDDEDWRAALNWGARARGSPGLMCVGGELFLQNYYLKVNS